MKTRTLNRAIVVMGMVTALSVGYMGAAAANCGTCSATCSATAKASSATTAKGPTIPEVANDEGMFKTLLAAVKAAGLGDTLSSEGPFTVFAPTDEAFAKLPEGTVEGLLEEPEKLKAVLLNHVVPGKLDAEKVVAATSLTTAFGQPVYIEAGKKGVMVGDARVVKTDVAASNGVIHVIDSVLVPMDLVDVAASTSDFSTLVAAVKGADLVEVLQGEGPFTVFAPTNEAFAKLPAGTVEGLLKPENREALQAILKYHVVAGSLKAADVVKLEHAETAQGESLKIKSSKKEGVTINEAKVLQTDIIATNGVIHVIDSVMLPAG